MVWFCPALRPDASRLRVILCCSESQDACAWYHCRDEHREAQPAGERDREHQKEPTKMQRHIARKGASSSVVF